MSFIYTVFRLGVIG